MKIEQLGPAACRSYLLSDEKTNDAILVDPLAEDVDRGAPQLERERVKVRLVEDTHTHADHVSGGTEIAKRLGAPYAAHENSSIPTLTEKLRDGQTLEAGSVRARVIHTPGHTPDSIS